MKITFHALFHTDVAIMIAVSVQPKLVFFVPEEMVQEEYQIEMGRWVIPK